jgi:hypothetical protein
MNTATETRLINIETQCARQVCGGGYITKAEADLLWALRTEVGKKYDAINGRWTELDAE